MLRLLRSEFAKLKRKPLFFAAAAASALIPLGCALFLPEMQDFSSGAEAVDRLMSTLFQMSAYLLLMPALVVLASNLLFEEQDNDTLKNLIDCSREQTCTGSGEDDIAFSVCHRLYGRRQSGKLNDGAGFRTGACRLLETFLCRNRPGDYDVGRGTALCSSGGALESQLHYFCDHYLFLYGSQLHLRNERFFYHAAVWIQSRHSVARTADFPLVLSVS